MPDALLLGLIKSQTDMLVPVSYSADHINVVVAQLVKCVFRISRQIDQFTFIKHINVGLLVEVRRPVLAVCLLQTVVQHIAFLDARNLQVARNRSLFIDAADVFELTRHRPLLTVLHQAAKFAVKDDLWTGLNLDLIDVRY